MLEIVLHGEAIAHIGSFTITNAMVYSWFVTGLLVVGALVVSRKTALVPGRFQGLVESVLSGTRDFMADVLGNVKHANKFFAFIATLFFFILMNNWLALLPFTSFGLYEQTAHGQILVPFLRTTNSDLNHTLILAVLAVIMIQVFGITTLGFFKYAHKFFVNPFKDPIGCFIGILEIASEIAKLISFSFRLFGNIFAGEVLLVIISYLLPFGAPLPFMFLEMFVGLIQAVVFATLTLVFIKIATSEHH
jgi:F-type H+-transporting ATPase subunit a